MVVDELLRIHLGELSERTNAVTLCENARPIRLPRLRFYFERAKSFDKCRCNPAPLFHLRFVKQDNDRLPILQTGPQKLSHELDALDIYLDDFFDSFTESARLARLDHDGHNRGTAADQFLRFQFPEAGLVADACIHDGR